jgi:hypothetical protein
METRQQSEGVRVGGGGEVGAPALHTRDA